MVGGESAGGGLAAALCMLARDRGTVKIAYQFPLYPMLSNLDPESEVSRQAIRTFEEKFEKTLILPQRLEPQ